jgi:hypothetical protein
MLVTNRWNLHHHRCNQWDLLTISAYGLITSSACSCSEVDVTRLETKNVEGGTIAPAQYADFHPAISIFPHSWLSTDH